jgi:CDP-diacylglycerol pyrophosphatase
MTIRAALALSLLVFAPVFALVFAGAAPARAGDPDALWHIIHDRCLPGFLTKKNPAPCAEVDLPPGGHEGWVVLKDRDGATQYLVMPTEKITGIEDPALLAPGEPNFFAAAWDARKFFLAKVGHEVPRSVISLAINSPYGRTQNQLHIHIDCIRADVAATIAKRLREFGNGWTRLPLLGHDYRARRLDGADLTVNPFTLLASDPTVGVNRMARHTLVVVAERFPNRQDGFVLLDDHVDVPTGDRASGEELQDHACAILR